MNNADRVKAMLKYLPCKAGAIPKNLRNLLTAEREGLAWYKDNAGTWHLTPKGELFLEGKLAAPKSPRRLAPEGATVCADCGRELPKSSQIAGGTKRGLVCSKCWHKQSPKVDCASAECKRKGCGPIYAF